MNCCKADSIHPSGHKPPSRAWLALMSIQDIDSIGYMPGMGRIITILISLVDKISETSSDPKGLRVGAVLREALNFAETLYRVMVSVSRDIQGIPSGHPRRHAVVDSLRRSLKLETRVTQLFSDLKKLQRKAAELYQGYSWLWWFYSSRDEKTLEEIRKGIADCREYFKLQCQVAIEATMEEVFEKLSGIEMNATTVQEVVVQVAAHKSYGTEERILESLPHADASYYSAVNAMRSNFLPGTRVELFHQIIQWAEERTPELSSKAVCILTGGAGTGKSTIASEFARWRNVKKDYGASFFFARGVEGLDSTQVFFSTLAYQLAQSQGTLRPHIIHAALEYFRRGKQMMEHEATNLLHRPFSEVKSRHPRVFLIIDALDECSRESSIVVFEMLELLIESVYQAQFPLRIFFTSRPNTLINDMLQRSQWASLIHQISLHSLSQEAVQRDMEIFVRDKLKKLPWGQVLLQERPEVVRRLAERAGGVFVHAKTEIDFLGDSSSSAVDGLDKGPLESVGELQIQYNHYHTVLKSAFQSEDLCQDPRLIQALQSTLGSIAVLRRPVSPEALESLNGVPHTETCNVLNRLRSILVYDPDSPRKKFHPLHETFPQFLLDSNHCKGTNYHVDVHRQHSRLAAGCLRALLTLKYNMCQLSDQAIPTTKVLDLTVRLRMYVPEQVQYACAHWAMHLTQGACGTEQEHAAPGNECSCEDIKWRLDSFARNKVGPWIEIMSYMGRLDMVAEGLDVVCAYLQGSLPCQGVASLLEGARKLVADHYSEIEKCPHDIGRLWSPLSQPENKVLNHDFRET